MPKNCERCNKSLPAERDRRYHPGFKLSAIPGFEGITAEEIREYNCICRECETALNALSGRIMADARYRREKLRNESGKQEDVGAA